MNWKQVSINANEQICDIVSSVLLDAGAHGVEIAGGADENSKLSCETVSGENVTVKAYYGEYDFDRVKAYITGRIESLKLLGAPSAENLTFETKTIEDADWSENFRKHFSVFRAAGRIVVKPTWEQYSAKKDDIVIEIDPGMAFGSGTHETTSMSLELLQKYIKRGNSVLDVGCGSGILAIAAAKLGAEYVRALDYDSVSVNVAKDNAKANGTAHIEVFESDLLKRAGDGPYDLIIANIIADTLIKLNKKVGALQTEGGIYILSGIIKERLDEVLKSLKSRKYNVLETLNANEWVALSAVKSFA